MTFFLSAASASEYLPSKIRFLARNYPLISSGPNLRHRRPRPYRLLIKLNSFLLHSSKYHRARRPLPTGRASSHFSAGLLYHRAKPSFCSGISAAGQFTQKLMKANTHHFRKTFAAAHDFKPHKFAPDFRFYSTLTELIIMKPDSSYFLFLAPSIKSSRPVWMACS